MKEEKGNDGTLSSIFWKTSTSAFFSHLCGDLAKTLPLTTRISEPHVTGTVAAQEKPDEHLMNAGSRARCVRVEQAKGERGGRKEKKIKIK